MAQIADLIFNADQLIEGLSASAGGVVATGRVKYT
jgi:hypothetical protein